MFVPVRWFKQMLLWVRIAYAEGMLAEATDERDVILQERWVALDTQDSAAYVMLTRMHLEAGHEIERIQTRRDDLALQLERLRK
jgi:hypothetical protein